MRTTGSERKGPQSRVPAGSQWPDFGCSRVAGFQVFIEVSRQVDTGQPKAGLRVIHEVWERVSSILNSRGQGRAYNRDSPSARHDRIWE